MNFRQLTDSQCGQSNPLVQLSSQVSRDPAFMERMGMPKPDLMEGNSMMPPQSFRMNDLMTEINNLESHPNEYIAMNRSFNRTTEALLQANLGTLHLREQPPQSTYFYKEIPQQAMCFPYQAQPNMMTKGFQKKSKSDFVGLSTYDKSKYIVIESLEDLKNAEEYIEKPPEVQTPILHQDTSDERDKVREESFGPLLRTGKEFLANGNIPWKGWQLLGIARAENAENSKAIDALTRGLSLKPHDLGILMALAECYANQKNIPKVVSTLLAWLVHHPAYQDIIPENFEDLKKAPISNINVEVVQNMLIEAARRRPSNLDHEVQNALGLLLYVNKDYDRAIDCFRAALQVRPRDSRLWNRLGVTLSHLDRHGEAFEVYERVLNLDQGFVLSRYNYAMALMDTKAYKEAARQFLIIANQQAERRSNVNSSHGQLLKDRFNGIWWNLGLCISYMDRSDLEKHRKKLDLEALNKEFLLDMH